MPPVQVADTLNTHINSFKKQKDQKNLQLHGRMFIAHKQSILYIHRDILDFGWIRDGRLTIELTIDY